jgi:hypothetical protein
MPSHDAPGIIRPRRRRANGYHHRINFLVRANTMRRTPSSSSRAVVVLTLIITILAVSGLWLCVLLA